MIRKIIAYIVDNYLINFFYFILIVLLLFKFDF